MNFFTNKFSLISLVFSFLLFIYTFHQSEILFHGDKRDYYKIYYLISLILMFFSIISFFFNSSIKKYLIIIISTLIFSLYFSESYLIINKNFINSKLKEFDKKKELFIKTKKI